MAKQDKRHSGSAPRTPSSGRAATRWATVIAVIVVVGAAAAFMNRGQRTPDVTTPSARGHQSPANTPAATTPAPATPPASDLPTNEVNSSLVVTHDLDFGGALPSVADAMREIDRRHQPDDGQGRTFAILEAFSQGHFDGKLRLSLRVSTEKPGVGEIVFRRTGQSLWKSRIVVTAHKNAPFKGGALTILFDDGAGKSFTVDGSSGPSSLLEAMLKEPGIPVAQAWPDGQERELTFIYSACGCPVKVPARRVGDRTVRVKDTQVIFPDDPAAVQVINQLMRW